MGLGGGGKEKRGAHLRLGNFPPKKSWGEEHGHHAAGKPREWSPAIQRSCEMEEREKKKTRAKNDTRSPSEPPPASINGAIGQDDL